MQQKEFDTILRIPKTAMDLADFNDLSTANHAGLDRFSLWLHLLTLQTKSAVMLPADKVCNYELSRRSLQLRTQQTKRQFVVVVGGRHRRRNRFHQLTF